MSLRAVALRFYLRHWFKRRLDPDAPVSALRANVDDLVRKMPKPPKEVTLSPTTVGGVPAEWVTAKGADPKRAILHFHGGGYASGSVAGATSSGWGICANSDSSFSSGSSFSL